MKKLSKNDIFNVQKKFIYFQNEFKLSRSVLFC